MRALSIAVVLLSANCERAGSRDVKDEVRPQPTLRDAAVARDASVREFLDGLKAPYPPPPPIVRKFKRGDCKSEYAPRPDRDPNPMCRVKGGMFQFGEGGSVFDTHKQVHEPRKAVATTLDDFFIDQFEVTAAQAVLFLNAHGNVCVGLDKIENSPDPPDCVWIGSSKRSGIEIKHGRYAVIAGMGPIPEPYFSWEGALRYCAWVGKQVPSSAQWEYAGRHDPATGRDLMYPWGDRWVAHHATCNARECDPRPRGFDPIDVRRFPVGYFDGGGMRGDSSSPWGVHDMAAGVSELVFECDAPMKTCVPGQDCRCAVLQTASDGVDTLEMLRLAFRFNNTAQNFGRAGVRCAVRDQRPR